MRFWDDLNRLSTHICTWSANAVTHLANLHAGATLKSGPLGDCLLHVPASPEMPSKASPCVQLHYMQRPVFYREAPGGLQGAAAPASIRDELSLEALVSITLTGGTISACEGDLALPWLGQLGSFFAVGMLAYGLLAV